MGAACRPRIRLAFPLKPRRRAADPLCMSALTHPATEGSALGSTADVSRQSEVISPFYRVSVKALVFDAGSTSSQPHPDAPCASQPA